MFDEAVAIEILVAVEQPVAVGVARYGFVSETTPPSVRERVAVRIGRGADPHRREQAGDQHEGGNRHRCAPEMRIRPWPASCGRDGRGGNASVVPPPLLGGPVPGVTTVDR